MSETPMTPERESLRAALVEALDNAHQTYPCPVTGSPYWTGCVHPDGTGQSCHSERRAEAVLAVRDNEVDGLRARVAELEAQRAALAVRLRKGQRWEQGRTPPLVTQDYVGQDELRSIFGITLTPPWEAPVEDPCHPCGCPKRFNRHAWGCPETGGVE
ncbi:hypothetical protein [Streptomyces sp. SID4982]|uniref:hypothetical protein n=1 Tax=Streptomyces sp. SID4982 TaxID=2690291 RepID=UPI0013684A8E|nr:hypothetical protein [Streptomyces sp. SID4982]MYS15071.1 hypothetical protein [Streptomyces sp. SID4982]